MARNKGLVRLDTFDYGILAFVVLSRLLLIAVLYPEQERMENGDSALYECLAVNYLAGGHYACAEYEPFSDMIRTPGYPLVILANYAVFGSGNFLWPILWNIPAVVLLLFGMRRFLRELGLPEHRGMWCLFALDMAWLLYCKELVPEPVFTALFMWAFVYLARSDSGHAAAGRWQSPCAAGVLLALATLVKPVSLYVAPLAVLFLLIRRRSLRPALLFLLAFGIGIAPWLIRNKIVHDSYSFTSIQNANLGIGHTSYVWAELHGLSYNAAHLAMQERVARHSAHLAAENYRAIDSVRLANAREILFGHPHVYARTIAKGALITLLDPGRLVLGRTLYGGSPRQIGFTNLISTEGLSGAFLRIFELSPLMASLLISYLLFLLLFCLLVLGGIPAFWRAHKAWCIFILLVIAYLLLAGGPSGYARFRLYIFPFLLLYANFALLHIREWRGRRNKPAFIANMAQDRKGS